MSTKKAQKESKFAKYMKGPVRILARARDFYVHTLSGCAGQVGHGHMGCATPLPRSFSANSSYSEYSNRDEDLRELIRIASNRGLIGNVQAEILRSKNSTPIGGDGAAVVRRSRTVAIGRIDEDKPCEFGDDVVEVYPRSKSCEVSGR